MTVPQSEGFEYGPDPWRTYRAGLFRLAGFGGALVILRSGVVHDPPALSLDVGFLGPRDYVWAIRRPMTAELPDELGDFFFGCAEDLQPQSSLIGVADALSGLSVRALDSTDQLVELEFDVGDEGLNLQTTRVALTLAAEQVRALVAPKATRLHGEDW